MKNLEQILGLSDAELTREALSRKITANRFRVPAAADDVARLLEATYCAEVISRGRQPFGVHTVRPAIKALAQELAGTGGYCGALLCGRCGNGKTTLLRAVKALTSWLADRGVIDVLRWRSYLVSARLLAEEARTDHGGSMRVAEDIPLLFIDDLGEEPAEVLRFGNVINPSISLLERRYNRQLPTFITTNLTPREITEKYGERIGDRMREMVRVVAMPENVPSFRGN